MNSRFAQIITDATGPDGRVDREKLYRAFLVEPGDPTTIIVEACGFSTEQTGRQEQIARRIENAVQGLDAYSRRLAAESARKVDAGLVGGALTQGLVVALQKSELPKLVNRVVELQGQLEKLHAEHVGLLREHQRFVMDGGRVLKDVQKEAGACRMWSEEANGAAQTAVKFSNTYTRAPPETHHE